MRGRRCCHNRPIGSPLRRGMTGTHFEDIEFMIWQHGGYIMSSCKNRVSADGSADGQAPRLANFVWAYGTINLLQRMWGKGR